MIFVEYEKLKKTKFFENYQKALRREQCLEVPKNIKKIKIQNKIYYCCECSEELIERKNGKYIFSEELNASFLKEIRIKCPCGKVNIFKVVQSERFR